MDARTLARLARVNIGTFNVWAHRGLLPGLETGVRGRRRNIEPTAATGILIFAELVRFGFSPDDASRMVSAMTDFIIKEGFLVVPQPKFGEGRYAVAGGVIHARDHAEMTTTTQNPRFPPIYLVLKIRDLADQVRQAEREWEETARASNPNG
jgi:hypothetical protein